MSHAILRGTAVSVIWLGSLSATLFAQRIYLGGTSSTSGVFSVVDAPAQTVFATVKTADEPGSIVFSPDGTRAWGVMSDRRQFIFELDTFSNRVVRTAGLGDVGPILPWNLVLSRRTNRLLVPFGHAFFSGVLLRFDINTLIQLPRVEVASCPSVLALSPDEATGYMFEGCTGNLVILDALLPAVKRKVPLTQAYEWGWSSVQLSSDGSRLYLVDVVNNSILEVDTATYSVTRRIAVAPPIDLSVLPHQPGVIKGLRLSPDDGKLYVNVSGRPFRTRVWDTREHRWAATLSYLTGIAFTDGGRTIWASGEKTLVALDAANYTEIARIVLPHSYHAIAIAPDNIPRCGGVAAPVNDRFQITRSGFRYNFSTRTFTQTLTVTNTSGATINEVVSVVLTGLSANASLISRTGSTVCRQPAGEPFVHLPSFAYRWAPGDTRIIVLEFANPSMGPIQYRTELVGDGNR